MCAIKHSVRNLAFLSNCNYRPQTKFAKVMFLHLSVILFTGGVCLSARDQAPPPRPAPPLEQTPPSGSRHPSPPGAETATAADGTHPTGMHSCYLLRFMPIHIFGSVLVLHFFRESQPD